MVMTDAIDILLQDKQHPDAQRLLDFHHSNRDFLPRVVGEFRLLRRLGRKAGGIKALVQFLRWEQHWHGVDEFEVSQNLNALVIRTCTLLWPDINGMARYYRCEADDILGTRIVRRGTRYGNFIYPGRKTLNVGCSFLPPERNCTGLVRSIRCDGVPAAVVPPPIPVLDRPPTIHDLITESEANSIAEPLRRLVDESPNPRHPVLVAWLRHLETQPEIYAFMERTLLRRKPTRFSADSLVEYARWSIRRAAESHKRFTLWNDFAGLYCRALILRKPEFNGFCRFKDDGKRGRANRLLGCKLAPKPINGEPYRRLVPTREAQ
jgi:hypothetical protein